MLYSLQHADFVLAERLSWLERHFDGNERDLPLSEFTELAVYLKQLQTLSAKAMKITTRYIENLMERLRFKHEFHCLHVTLIGK